MELFQIKYRGPRGGERIYVIVNGFADVERYIERRKLEDAKVKCLAVDYASPWIVDIRTGAVQAEEKPAPIPVRLVARADAGSRQPQTSREHDSHRVERVKNSFQVRAPHALG